VKHLIILAVVIFASSVLADGIPDTPENRQKQAERYVQATPPRALIEDIAKKMAAARPASEREQREKLIDMLISQLDFDALKQAITNLVIKHFTAEEIKAMADFYGSPAGKSAMSKFRDYMADLMPVVQSEIAKAQAKGTQSKPNP